MNRSESLGTASIPSLLFKFSIPAIIGMVVNALYNIADRIFIGRGVGSLAIAGITVTFPVMLVIMGFGMLIGMGATALISIRLGEKRKEDAELILGNAVVLLVVFSLFFTCAGLVFLQPLLSLLSASPAVMPYAEAYLQVILAGTVFQAIGFGMNNFIRGEGNPRIAMVTMVAGALLNVILDPLFIFVFHWGVRGAALATIISQLVSALLVLHYFFSGKSLLKIRLSCLRLRFVIVKSIVAIGSAPFFLQISASVVNSLLNFQLRRYGGDVAISVMGIAFSVGMMILMPIFGLNQGSQPIIGFNYGARQFDRVKKTLQIAILAATTFTTFGFCIIMLFPAQLLGLFSRDDPHLITLGTQAMRTFFVMLPIIGFQIVSANYFQAIGKPKQAMFLSLSRQVLLLIPLLLLLPPIFGLSGVFVAGPSSDFGASLLTAFFLFFELRKLDRKHARQVNAG